MLHVDLSSLRGPELRRLLDTTRERGQAQLSYEILQEMAARRERGGKPSPQPRVVEMNLGDPLELEEEPLDDAPLDEPLSLTPEAAPPRGPEDAIPLHMPREAPPPRPPARRTLWPLATFAFGITLGAGLGWWAGGIASQPHAPRIAPDQTPPPAAATVAEAAPAIPAEPPPPPVAPIPAAAAPNAGEPNVAPEALANPPAAAPPPAAAADSDAAPPAAAAELAQIAPVAPAVPKRPAKPATPPAPAPEARTEPRTVASEGEPVRIAPAGPGGCAAQPTPADRTICADPRLQRLQRDLRKAYAEALAAHEDRATLRERQMAWKDQRDGVADPSQLARLYEARIRKLEAATADAKRRK